MRTATNNIGFLLQHLAFSLGRLNDQVLQERLGIGFSQFKLMMVLEKRPHIQQKQIAETLSQTEASISRQIRVLQEKGLLQTTVSPHNRREHITTLTPKGTRFTEEAIAILNNHYEPLFAQLTSKQQVQLGESLSVLHDHVCTMNNGTCQKFLKP